jgi:hypothetical protein
MTAREIGTEKCERNWLAPRAKEKKKMIKSQSMKTENEIKDLFFFCHIDGC